VPLLLFRVHSQLEIDANHWVKNTQVVGLRLPLSCKSLNFSILKLSVLWFLLILKLRPFIVLLHCLS